MRIATAGLALIIVGVAIFALTLVRLIGGAALDPQSKVPGSVSAEIDVPGRYYVWDNHWTMFDGQRVQYSADWPGRRKGRRSRRQRSGTRLCSRRIAELEHWKQRKNERWLC
jgi:hypothetical protein